MKNDLSKYLLLFFAFLLTSCDAKSTFDSAKLGTAELDVTYCTMNNLPQKMDIYYPSSGGPWPVLMYVHGGSWYQGDKAGEGWRG
jgi:acetyl esterase/lipase